MTIPSAEDRSALDWEARFASDNTPWERGAVHPAFEDWVRVGVIARERRILTPGAGRSQEPLAMAQLGLDVTVTDIAPSAIAWQEARFEAAGAAGSIEQADGLAWRPDTPFDLFYEQTFLCAIHPHHRQAYEAMAHDVLKPGGRLLALFMQKSERGGPPYGCDLDAMKTLFPDTRWVWPRTPFTPYPHPDLNNKIELAGVLTRR